MDPTSPRRFAIKDHTAMSISQRDFARACTQLHDRWQRQKPGGSWQDVKLLKNLGFEWLRIACAVHSEGADHERPCDGNGMQGERAIEEEDDEVLQSRLPQETQPFVVYDIVHSPSYQVPVLYITFRSLDLATRGLPSPEEVYEMLVLSQFRSQVDGVGPIGALSTTDHPVTSTPAYFVHPCRTAEAMEAVAGSKNATPEMYLLQWIGIIGQSFGLSVPLELAQSVVPVDDGGESA